MPDALHLRVRAGLRKPHNWLQLLKFCAVGGSGYAVNLTIFTVCTHVLDLGYLLAAAIAFVVALINNFWWNRHWTFQARAGRAGFQATRFIAVSVGAFFFATALLAFLVDVVGMAKVASQAISIVAATPLNFLGNKMWSFSLELQND